MLYPPQVKHFKLAKGSWRLSVNVCCSSTIMPPSPTAAVCTSPCQNGGTCTAPDTCACDVGWTGMQCERGGLDMKHRQSTESLFCQALHFLIFLNFDFYFNMPSYPVTFPLYYEYFTWICAVGRWSALKLVGQTGLICRLQNILTNVVHLVQDSNSQSLDCGPVCGISVKWWQ